MNARNSGRNVHAAGKVASSPDKQPKGSSPEAKQHDRNLAKLEAEHRKGFTADVRRG